MTQFLCVCVCRLSTPISNSQKPAGCLRIQLYSDTIYQEIESDNTGEGSQNHHPLQMPVAACVSGYKSDVLTTPSLGLINLLEQLTELMKTHLLTDYQSITNILKDIDQKRYEGIQTGKVLKKGSLSLWSLGPCGSWWKHSGSRAGNSPNTLPLESTLPYGDFMTLA